MKYEEAIARLEDTPQAGEAAEMGAEALAFVLALHQMFKSNGMTSKEEPDLNQLENLVDALHGELAAAVLFLCEGVFARVPDMLRVVSKNLEKDGTAPTVLVKGNERLAQRIENTRVAMQNLATTSEST